MRISSARAGSRKNRAACRISRRDSVARATPPMQEHSRAFAADRFEPLQARSTGLASTGAPIARKTARITGNFFFMNVAPFACPVRVFPVCCDQHACARAPAQRPCCAGGCMGGSARIRPRGFASVPARFHRPDGAGRCRALSLSTRWHQASPPPLPACPRQRQGGRRCAGSRSRH